MRLLAIDPGISTGWALYFDNRLCSCGLSTAGVYQLHNDDPFFNYDDQVVDQVWIEKPVVYPRSKARPNDLITLAIRVGWTQRFWESGGANVSLVAPYEWKGQQSKDVSNAASWSTLDPVEQDLVSTKCKGIAPSKRHNVMDAIGIGLWALRRSRGATKRKQ